jgi:hypothetical protein
MPTKEDTSSDDKIVQECKDRFERSAKWEADARKNYIFDLKFANGDSQNMHQWDETISRTRMLSGKPCLTINQIKPHCLQIINDARANKSQIKIVPTGNGATFEAAEIFEGVSRHIEYISNAQAAYTNAQWSQVIGGIGYWRVVTDYAPNSFNQNIYIRRVRDPLSIYLDPDIEEADGSDARFAHVFEDIPRDLFEKQYPKKDHLGNEPLGEYRSEYANDAWETKDHVRVCEYFRRVEKVTDKLHLLDSGDEVLESDAVNAGLGEELENHSKKSRDIISSVIEWFLIAGQEIIDRKDWPGIYIPIVRVVGEETVIDKRLDRRGHTRAMLDSQRMLNFWESAAVEQVALQTKTPYIADTAAVAGYENFWATANTANRSYLPYNGRTETGEPIQRPEREQPPVLAPAYLQGLEMARQDLMAVSGQFEANMGQKSNEVSGTAVDARQRQGEIATYHYIDRFSAAIRFTGRILIDLIPKIYDSNRVLKIMGEDGSQRTVQVDPNHPNAHEIVQEKDSDGYDPQAITAIFNPLVGEYAVEADVGPEFSTRRQETFNAIKDLLMSDAGLAPVVGDLLFKAADFPMANEIAERLRRMVPQQALSDTPSPEIVQAQQAIAQLQAQLQAATSRMTEIEQQKSIDAYKAETDRMKAVGGIDPDALRPIIRQMVSEALGTPANPLIQAHQYEEAQAQAAIQQAFPAPQPAGQPQQEPTQ